VVCVVMRPEARIDFAEMITCASAAEFVHFLAQQRRGIDAVRAKISIFPARIPPGSTGRRLMAMLQFLGVLVIPMRRRATGHDVVGEGGIHLLGSSRPELAGRDAWLRRASRCPSCGSL